MAIDRVRLGVGGMSRGGRTEVVHNLRQGPRNFFI
jgi:hypothetical protein